MNNDEAEVQELEDETRIVTGGRVRYATMTFHFPPYETEDGSSWGSGVLYLCTIYGFRPQFSSPWAARQAAVRRWLNHTRYRP